MKKKELAYRGIIIIINFLLCFAVVYMMSIQTRNSIRANELNNTIVNTNKIGIFDNYGLPGHEKTSKIIYGEDAFDKLDQFYLKLRKNNGYEYTELHKYLIQKQGIFDENKEAIDGYGDIPDEDLSEFINQKLNIDGREVTFSNLKGLLMGDNIFESLNMEQKLVSGTPFKNSDFNRTGEVNEINVILGNSYARNHKVGEEFMGFYLGEELKFKVIGILEKDVDISLGNDVTNLDNYILIPSFSVSKRVYENSEKKSFYNLHYLNKIDGTINVQDEKKVKDTIRGLKKLLKQYTLDFSYESLGASYASDKTIISSATATKENAYIAILAFILLCFASNFVFVNYFKKNLKKYSIHLTNGASIRTIKRRIFVEMICLSIMGYVLSIAVYYIMFRNDFGRNVILTDCVITLIIQIISLAMTLLFINRYINKSPIYLSLRES